MFRLIHGVPTRSYLVVQGKCKMYIPGYIFLNIYKDGESENVLLYIAQTLRCAKPLQSKLCPEVNH